MDHAATTPPTCPEVVEEMLPPCFSERFGNPPSSVYALAREAQVTMERARGDG